MGPVRTKHHRQGPSQANEAAPSKPRVRVQQNRPGNSKDSDSTVIPGLQKIKSALRQTRRLLAKDNLAADVRVETERRQKALEADLHHAESSRKERALSVRYHKIKFFERQKVTRKLDQVKRRLESAENSSKSQLESTLSDLRVDLNYVLHYPKTKKYISLFPPDARQGQADVAVSSGESLKTDVGREEIRSWIRGRMENGELSSEPELEVKARRIADKKSAPRAKPWSGAAVGPELSENPTSRSHVPENITQDDFFDTDYSE